MPAPYKCTWFFEGVQQSMGATASSAVGWTETWYRSFDSPEAALREMISLGPGNTYLKRRLPLLGSWYRCKWARASSVINPRLSKTAPMPVDDKGQLPDDFAPDGHNQGAQITCAVLIDFYAPPLDGETRAHHRRFLLRGLPRTVISGNIVNEESPDWRAILAFCNYLAVARAPAPAPVTAGPWGMRVQSPTVPFVPLDALTVANANHTLIVVAFEGAGLASVGTRYEVRQVGFPRGVNRIWTALRLGAGPPATVTLARTKRALSGDWDGTGQIRRVAPVLCFPTQYTPIGLRTRKIGAPFRLTRGRRRNG